VPPYAVGDYFNRPLILSTPAGASFVEIAARRTADANCANGLGADLYPDCARQQENMGQLRQAAGGWCGPHALRDSAAGIFVAWRAEHHHGIGLVAGGIERRHRGAVAAQHGLFNAVGINNRRRDVIALPGASGDRFGDGLSGKRRRQPVRRQNVLGKSWQWICNRETRGP
jgi:hypothetical protein